MRHAMRGRILSRTPSHRVALFRNMSQSLIEHGQIRTTVIKAKEVRPFAEKLLQLAVDGAAATKAGDKIRAVTLRQRAIAMLNDRQIIPAEHREEYDGLSDAKRDKVLRNRSGRRYRAPRERASGVKFTSESVIHRLFATVGPALLARNEARGSRGGYTRIIKLADRRLGDGGQLAILQIVDESETPRTQNKTKTERRRKATTRYAFYAGKTPQRRGAKRGGGKAEAAPVAAAEAPVESEASPEASDAGADTQSKQSE